MKNWKELAGLAGVIGAIAGGLVAVAFLLKSVTNMITEIKYANAMGKIGTGFEKLFDLTTKYINEEIKDKEEERASRIIRKAEEY